MAADDTADRVANGELAAATASEAPDGVNSGSESGSGAGGAAGSGSGSGSGAGALLEPPDPALRSARRPWTSLLTFGTVALVLVIVIVLVVIKVTGNSAVSTPSSTVLPSPAPQPVVQAVTHIPASVYDTVGVSSPVATVRPPDILHGQPALSRGGKPEVLFVGNEFCPYCAAERWALVAALSRFGRFTTLNAMQSGGNEAFPNTPTFTFDGSHYTSRYLSAVLVEQFSAQKNGAGTGFAALHHLSSSDRALMARYEAQVPGATGGDLVPFVDIANSAVVAGGSFSPSIFQQLTATQIATGLTDPKDPATQAIVSTANYLSAVICSADSLQPAAVCTSPGVALAASDLGLGP